MSHYFKDPSGKPFHFEDNVTPEKAADGTYSFKVYETVHVPDVVVHHPAEIVHHDQVLGIDEETKQPVVVTAAYDEEIKAAYDEITVPAHDEIVLKLTLEVPSNLVQIDEDEFKAIEAANQAPSFTGQNINGFVVAVKAAVGGIIAANALSVAYPLFFAAVQQGDWTDVQALIIDAKSKNVITSDQYAAIKAAAATNNIPLTLP